MLLVSGFALSRSISELTGRKDRLESERIGDRQFSRQNHLASVVHVSLKVPLEHSSSRERCPDCEHIFRETIRDKILSPGEVPSKVPERLDRRRILLLEYKNRQVHSWLANECFHSHHFSPRIHGQTNGQFMRSEVPDAVGGSQIVCWVSEREARPQERSANTGGMMEQKPDAGERIHL